MPDPRVAIESSMAHHFRLEAWDALDDGGRLALGDYLTERLQAHGRDVPEPLTLGTFGPPDSPRSVLQWREPASGMTFSLVPGGTFRPGYDEARLARFEQLRSEQDGEWDEEEFGPPEPGRALVFGCAVPCDLRLGPAVEVAPLLMAAEPVRPSLPGLRSAVRLPDHLFGGGATSYSFMGDAIHFAWPQVGPVLAHYGWSLPTSGEFEWALQGGAGSLFYWGDELPRFMRLEADRAAGDFSPGPLLEEWRAEWQSAFDEVMSADFEPRRPRAWPFCNRFGLAAMLPLRTWCAPSTEPGDPAPIRVRGGAAYCYPWQGCGEWSLLLSAAESRSEDQPGYADDSVIRPVIRLGVE